MTFTEIKPAVLRSGTAARLAGITPSTLRIWEHRYGVVAPPRSPAGQRSYSMADVQRLRLIKQLTLEGHAIGTVAGLDHDVLVALSSGEQAQAPGRQRVVVVGQGLARRLEGRLRPPAAKVYDNLEQAHDELHRGNAVDVLVVQLASLQPSTIEPLLALRAGLPAQAVIVVYAFGTEAAVQALRQAGVTVRREPISGIELARLIAATRPLPNRPSEARHGRKSPRLYSDEELAALSEMPSRVACECPRHLAEIVTLLAGFEHYSAECISASPGDAALHRHLQDLASETRAMFEQALARVVVDEGLKV